MATDRDLAAEHVRLRTALEGLVGASKPDELEQMELFARMAKMPERERVAILNAIHCLQEVTPIDPSEEKKDAAR